MKQHGCWVCDAVKRKYRPEKSCFKNKCGLVRYCSKYYQTEDWADHKARCKEAQASLKS